ncbi:hypothetical protein [Klebsiella oxytoca]|uniref:hypothetical protein n=1 Tax=Klebsiella oxytoca TaxID=571 RepID=UPI0018A850AF|nr:hypothetical protein [Klebsiella oxytoca]
MGIRNGGWWQANEHSFCYDLPPHRLILEVAPGFVHYNMDARASQQFIAITLNKGEPHTPLSTLSPRDLSEALSSVELIFRQSQ